MRPFINGLWSIIKASAKKSEREVRKWESTRSGCINQSEQLVLTISRYLIQPTSDELNTNATGHFGIVSVILIWIFIYIKKNLPSSRSRPNSRTSSSQSNCETPPSSELNCLPLTNVPFEEPRSSIQTFS
jgi:hypothetical protein